MLEHTVTIAKPALGINHRPRLPGPHIEGSRALENIFEFGSVSPYVLIQCATHRTWNEREILKTAEPALHRLFHQIVPGFPGPGSQCNSAATLHKLRSAQIHFNHQSIKTGVGKEDVASASKHEGCEAPLTAKLEGFFQLHDTSHAREEPRRSAQPEGGQWGERHTGLGT